MLLNDIKFITHVIWSIACERTKHNEPPKNETKCRTYTQSERVSDGGERKTREPREREEKIKWLFRLRSNYVRLIMTKYLNFINTVLWLKHCVCAPHIWINLSANIWLWIHCGAFSSFRIFFLHAPRSLKRNQIKIALDFFSFDSFLVRVFTSNACAQLIAQNGCVFVSFFYYSLCMCACFFLSFSLIFAFNLYKCEWQMKETQSAWMASKGFKHVCVCVFYLYTNGEWERE